jgi:two-component system, chemotaxis family, chemotaxis protein CheY
MSERCALVVEDSPTMRQLLSLALRRVPGLYIVEAESGAHALQLLEEVHADLILLDLNMPVMNGFAFLERLAERDERPPVIVVTTESAQEDIQRARALGAVAYVTKPVRGPELATTVQRVLGEIEPR